MSTGQSHADNRFCSCGHQGAGTGGDGTAGGEDIVDQKEPLSPNVGLWMRAVCAEDIGTTLSRSFDGGLGRIVPRFLQSFFHRNIPFGCGGLGQQLGLVKAAGKISPGADGNKGHRVKPIPQIFRSCLGNVGAKYRCAVGFSLEFQGADAGFDHTIVVKRDGAVKTVDCLQDLALRSVGECLLTGGAHTGGGVHDLPTEGTLGREEDIQNGVF